MNIGIVILIAIVAAVAYYVWNQRSKQAGLPAIASAGAGSPAAAPAATGPLASYDAYRAVSPSNMINGKLTCNRCGSNLIGTAGGLASCNNCGTQLYRA